MELLYEKNRKMMMKVYVCKVQGSWEIGLARAVNVEESVCVCVFVGERKQRVKCTEKKFRIEFSLFLLIAGKDGAFFSTTTFLYDMLLLLGLNGSDDDFSTRTSTNHTTFSSTESEGSTEIYRESHTHTLTHIGRKLTQTDSGSHRQRDFSPTQGSSPKGR